MILRRNGKRAQSNYKAYLQLSSGAILLLLGATTFITGTGSLGMFLVPLGSVLLLDALLVLKIISMDINPPKSSGKRALKVE